MPDEILLCILNKLNNIDLLYSVANVNDRLNRVANHSISIDHLDFTENEKSEQYYQFLDRFCTNILPQIHHQINKLTLGQLSIERLLHSVEYPQLSPLSFVNLKQYEPI